MSTVSAAALTAVLVAGSMGSPALADETVHTGEAIVVGNGVDPFEVIGPDKLTVEQGASVEGQSATPVFISGTGATIDNSGQIFTADGQESAVYVSASGAGVDIDIINQAGGEISSVNESTLLGKNTGSGSVTLDNYGSIVAHTAEGELRGQLRLTCSVSFAYAQLGAAIADFLTLHPQLKIDLDASEGSLNLVERRIDLAIRISAEPDPLLIGRPLARCDSVLVASPAYLATHGTPAHPSDLGSHRCLSYANFGKSVWQLTHDGATERVSVTSHFSANEATTLMRAALADGGIALQPTYLANPHLRSGELQAVLPAWSLPAMTIHALYPSRRHLSPAVRALLDFLVQRFEGTPW